MPLDVGASLSFSGEYYMQKGNRGPPDAFGILTQYDLFPRLDVFMFRVGYSHGL